MHDAPGVAGSGLVTKRVASLGLKPMWRARDRKLLGPYAIIEPGNQPILRPRMAWNFLLVKYVLLMFKSIELGVHIFTDHSRRAHI